MFDDYPEFVVKSVLQSCESDAQFEDFCVAHYSKADGVRYVPTSRSWDAARDGREEWTDLKRGTSFLCSSLEGDAASKARGDLKRLVQTSKPTGRVRFCFRNPVGDTTRDAILAEAREIWHHATYEVAGEKQVIWSIGGNQVPFSEIFRGEVGQWKRLSARSTTADDATAMRVGLALQLNAAATELRKELIASLVLDILSDINTAASDEIANTAGIKLNLNGSISTDYLQPSLDLLLARGLL